jgi:hypothetical protein
MLCLIARLPTFGNLKFEISNLKSLCEDISRQVRGWAQSLQESPIQGQRLLSQKSRRFDKARRDREQTLEELRARSERTLKC